MDRLTDAGYVPERVVRNMNMVQLAEMYKKLCEYEGTGLTTEEIMDGKMLTGWIPVEERLPEEQENVLIQWELSRRHDNTVEIYLDKGRVCYSDRVYWLCDWGTPNGKVVAWMPLPEPYNPEEDQP